MASDPGLILAFDTSAAHCAAVLVRDGRVLASRDEAMERGQAERLLPMIEEVLREAGTDRAAIGGIAAVTGPGNFTGIRIAAATARGLAMALGVPAVGVSRFEALADRPGPAVVTLVDKRGTMAQAFVDGRPLGPAGDAAGIAVPAGACQVGEARADLAVVASIAARRLDAGAPPAPLYLRPADAMPPAEAPPRLLDDA